jgi:hypothetical protein
MDMSQWNPLCNWYRLIKMFFKTSMNIVTPTKGLKWESTRAQGPGFNLQYHTHTQRIIRQCFQSPILDQGLSVMDYSLGLRKPEKNRNHPCKNFSKNWSICLLKLLFWNNCLPYLFFLCFKWVSFMKWWLW